MDCLSCSTILLKRSSSCGSDRLVSESLEHIEEVYHGVFRGLRGGRVGSKQGCSCGARGSPQRGDEIVQEKKFATTRERCMAASE